jgi:hypothetical protein
VGAAGAAGRDISAGIGCRGPERIWPGFGPGADGGAVGSGLGVPGVEGVAGGLPGAITAAGGVTAGGFGGACTGIWPCAAIGG